MTRATKRAGLVLVLLGILGVLFFWTTDPHYGPAMHRAPQVAGHADPRYWLFVLRGSPDNLLDAANEARLSTFVGLAGSTAVLLVGGYLMTRRTV